MWSLEEVPSPPSDLLAGLTIPASDDEWSALFQAVYSREPHAKFDESDVMRVLKVDSYYEHMLGTLKGGAVCGSYLDAANYTEMDTMEALLERLRRDRVEVDIFDLSSVLCKVQALCELKQLQVGSSHWKLE